MYYNKSTAVYEAVMVHWEERMESVWEHRPDHKFEIVFSDVHGINWDFMGGEYIGTHPSQQLY